ncbi:Exocyst complex component 3 [Taenia solium]|eukprot:TsM_000458100 transcript=TsM_000458100 gene=TsM_000458100
MKSSYVDSLSRLEEIARRNAEKRVVEAFQKPESLENIDVIRTRFLNQKTATEAQLKMAVHGQLDSIQSGLDKLESALGISKACAGRISEMENSLSTISTLPSSLSQLHVISTKHKQLVAAIENMSYLVKVPDAMVEAKNYVENDNLLEAHKRIQELEGIRDEIMSDVFKQNSSADLDTLRIFFKGLDELNAAILEKIKHVGATLTSAVVTQNILCVNCIRIIDREERADMIWKKRQGKGGFMPDGRPKEWRKKFFAELTRIIQDRVQACSVDSENEKTRLVRHNEAIRQHALRDLRIAKNICPVYFPPDYEIFDRFVEIYHDAIGMHIENLINEGLNDTEIVQLLGWINAYHTEEFMKHPLFNVDFSRLNIKYPPNLLPEDKLMSLRQEYVKKTITKLNGWLVKSLAIDVEDWKRSTKPELNDASNYYTPLSLMVLSPINELVGEGKLLHFLGNVVRENFLVQCTQEITRFSRDYESSIRDYRNLYLNDRAKFPYYIEYILANANNTLTIANSFAAVINREVENDAHLKGRLLPQLGRLKEEYSKVAALTLNFTSVHERHTAGEKLIQSAGILKTFFENKIPVSPRIYDAYEAIGLIGRFLTNDDRSMLSLDVGRLQQSFPDVRTDQIYTILMLRGDIRSNDAQERLLAVSAVPKSGMFFGTSRSGAVRVLYCSGLRASEKVSILTAKGGSRNVRSALGSTESSGWFEEQEKLHEKLENLSDSLLRETDARKLAILDLNHLRTEYSDLLEYTKELNYQNQEGGDPVTLKIALDRALEAHTQALRRIVYLETEYNDVVPKREFSEVQNRLLLAESEVERLKAQCQDLDTQLVAKTEELSAIVREKRELADMFAALQNVSTPRPDWPRVGALVPGGRRRWQQLATGKTSKEKLVIFATELAGEANVAPLIRSDGRDLEVSASADTVTARSTMTAAGMAATAAAVLPFTARSETKKKVPKFLEECLQMSPHLFPKHDLLLLLEYVWLGRQKQLADYLKSRGAKEHFKLPKFNDFLNDYLKKAFGVEAIRREWCLSLYVAGSVMTECEEIVRFRKVIDNEVDEAYHWYLHSLTGRLFGQLREMAHATAIAFALSKKPTEAGGETVSVAATAVTDGNEALREPKTECRLTAHQLGIILAKLFQCEPQNPAVLRLIQAAVIRDGNDEGEGEALATTAIDMDMLVSLEELFHQAPGEQLPHFAQKLVSHLEQGRKTIIEHIITEIQRQKSKDVTTSMVTPAEVLEAMKVVRPEFESIIDSSPNCFFSLKQQQEPPEDKGGSLQDVVTDGFAVCDLDETNATPEEQALAWARCASSEEAKNYLTATVHWVFQTDSVQTTTADRAIPLEVLEHRLYGANIKPNNRITTVS